MMKRAFFNIPTRFASNKASSFQARFTVISKKFFSHSLLTRKEEEDKPLSYSEQITKQIIERYKNILEMAGDKSGLEKLQEQLESEDNQTHIQNIIRNVRLDLVDEPSEEIKKAQEDKMDDKRKQQFEERKRAEIERRKNSGKEKKEPSNKIEYRVVERS
ncbi:hypothetical protein C9374_012466 [Naegleria lovaniensis]|uniref:Uncharacterized protein n=1 Tax=Naegleria lovaniensis TaxID=51637 RepID=A0AA88KQY2_NAELO|nr:uncharacterized protein C9374_012466 [Naegleria lovaniensis]KAG2392214.1 hypothetical protein C9374_012466 [Naegleria lovaniensis]